jgi:hypothetical protein
MANQLQTAPDGEVPIRGARKLARAAYGSCEDKDVKRFYNEWPSLPVFRLKPRGPLHGYASQLRAHFEALSEEAARRAVRAAGGEAVGPVAQKSEAAKPVAQRAETAKPKPRQGARRRRSQIAAE